MNGICKHQIQGTQRNCVDNTGAWNKSVLHFLKQIQALKQINQNVDILQCWAVDTLTFCILSYFWNVRGKKPLPLWVVYLHSLNKGWASSMSQALF